jgi:hypothetical protein
VETTSLSPFSKSAEQINSFTFLPPSEVLHSNLCQAAALSLLASNLLEGMRQWQTTHESCCVGHIILTAKLLLPLRQVTAAGGVDGEA